MAWRRARPTRSTNGIGAASSGSGWSATRSAAARRPARVTTNPNRSAARRTAAPPARRAGRSALAPRDARAVDVGAGRQAVVLDVGIPLPAPGLLLLDAQ